MNATLWGARRNFSVIMFFVACLLGACDDDGSVNVPGNNDTTGDQCIGEDIRKHWTEDCHLNEAVEQYLQGLCDAGAKIKTVQPRCLPIGEFYYADVSLDNGGVLREKFYVGRDGIKRESDSIVRQYREEMARLWGNIVPRLVKKLVNADDSDVFDIVVTAYTQRDNGLIYSALLSLDSETKIIHDNLEFRLNATKKQMIEHVVPLAGIQYVAEYDDTEMLAEQASYDGSSGQHTHSSTFFNYNEEVFGTGVRVGFDDSMLGKGDVSCAIAFSPLAGGNRHQAFSFSNGVTYLNNTFLLCDRDEDCQPSFSFCGGDPQCWLGVCVSGHATKVASRVAASRTKREHASNVHMLVANDESRVRGNKRIRFFEEQAADIVNYSALSTGSGIDITEYNEYSAAVDYMIRKGISVTEVSGNKGLYGCPPSGFDISYPNYRVFCTSRNSLCVGGSHDMGWPYDRHSNALYSGSRWEVSLRQRCMKRARVMI